MTHEDDDRIDSHARLAAEQWPLVDPVVEAITNRIHKVGRYLNRTMSETEASLRLNSSEFHLLFALWKAGPQSPGALGERLLVSSGVMTNRLDRLAERGLIERRPHPTDRRGVVVEITDGGMEALDRMVTGQVPKEKELFADLTEEEREQLNRLLRKVMARLDPSVPLDVPEGHQA